MRAADVRPGDRIDLEGDEFADDGQEPSLPYELAEVVTIDLETPECIAIGFDGLGVIGFPVDHTLQVTRSTWASR